MDHVDIAADADITRARLATLQVRLPFSADSTKKPPPTTSSSSSSASSTSYSRLSIVKPTLGKKVVFVSSDDWVPDNVVASCMAPECKAPFTLFNRKHHCRVCGRIFCASCSSHLMADENNITGRLCSECFYENQLVITRRAASSSRALSKQKARGELKMFQWPLLVQILSYLPMRDLLHNASLVNSSFYFMSRDNHVWYLYNMPKRSSEGLTAKLTSRQSAALLSNKPSAATTAPPAISHNARYNFTQFLDYSRQLEAARCQGMSSFSAGAKQLLSSTIKICVVGPPKIGKSQFVRRFLNVGESAGVVGQQNQSVLYAQQLATGFVAHSKRVALTGGLQAETVLQVLDVGGDSRYEQLRILCARESLAVVVCYNCHDKASLVAAAEIAAALEEHLGPQPSVVCGIVSDPQARREVTIAGAEGISPRCRASIQTANPTELFETVMQALLDRLVAASTPAVSGGRGGEIRAGKTAQLLLEMSTNPSVLDVMLGK